MCSLCCIGTTMLYHHLLCIQENIFLLENSILFLILNYDVPIWLPAMRIKVLPNSSEKQNVNAFVDWKRGRVIKMKLKKNIGILC